MLRSFLILLDLFALAQHRREHAWVMTRESKNNVNGGSGPMTVTFWETCTAMRCLPGAWWNGFYVLHPALEPLTACTSDIAAASSTAGGITCQSGLTTTAWTSGTRATKRPADALDALA